MSNANETAYPCVDNEGMGDPGLTKREAFAMAAMQGLLSSTNYPASINGVDACEYKLCASASVLQADALLVELDK